MYGAVLGFLAIVGAIAIFSPRSSIGETVKTFASNPVYALFIGGVISIIIWDRQTTLARSVQAEREKKALYREFVAQIEKCTARVPERNRENWHIDPDIRRLWSLQSEIKLTAARKEVIERSAGVVVAINDYWMREVDRVISFDGKERTLWDNISFESNLMLDAMRKELDGRR